jgi:hypothetical protein
MSRKKFSIFFAGGVRNLSGSIFGRGTASDTVWTCDFSYDYVKINADYRS